MRPTAPPHPALVASPNLHPLPPRTTKALGWALMDQWSGCTMLTTTKASFTVPQSITTHSPRWRWGNALSDAGPIPLEADCMRFQPLLGWRPASTTHYNKIITGANFPISKGLRAALHLEAKPIPLEVAHMKFQPFLGWRPASTTHYSKIIRGPIFS
jgi:hypothetical protein